MKWNKETDEKLLEANISLISRFLGVPIPFFKDIESEMVPYASYILKYLSFSLLDIEDKPLLDKVKRAIEIYHKGTRDIIEGRLLDLLKILKIDTSTDFIEGEEIPYNKDHFILTWGSVAYSLISLLKLLYGNQLSKIDYKCPCECPTLSTLDTWSSKTYGGKYSYPHDSAYITDQTTVGSFTGGSSTSSLPECTTCGKGK